MFKFMSHISAPIWLLHNPVLTFKGMNREVSVNVLVHPGAVVLKAKLVLSKSVQGFQQTPAAAQV